MKRKIANEKISELLCILVLGVITFVFLLQSPQCIWQKTDTSIDSSVFNYIGLAMTKGAVPYRDVFDHKGLLLYFLNAIGAFISKDSGIWFVEFLSMMATLYIMYRIARLFTTRWFSILLIIISLCPMFTYFEGGNFTEEFALPHIAYAVFCFIDYFVNSKITNFRLVLCGLSFAAVLFLRQNMIAVWLVFCIGVLVNSILKKEYKQLARFILYFLVGVFILVIPFIIYILANNAWKDFIYDYWIYNFSYTSDSGVSKWQAFFHFANNIIIIAAFVCILYRIVKEKNKFDVLYLICMLATIGVMALSGYTFAHYAMIMLPLLIYPFVNALKDEKVNCVVLFILIFAVVPAWLTYVKTIDVKYKERNTEQSVGTTYDICSYIQQNTAEDDPIAVYGNWNIIYLQSNRMSATKYCYSVPTLEDEYYEELDKAKPVLIVMRPVSFNERMGEWLVANGYTLSYQIPDEALIYSRE